MNGENMNKENKKETVCAVVVTYNRKNLLLECLEAIRRQTRPVDGIYIIDNASDDGTPELLKENGYIPELPPFNLLEPYEIEHKISNLVDGNHINVFYVRMHKNTGGAGGFYEGVKRGYERGCDWLWLMDDDGLPEKDCLMKQIPNRKDIVTGPYIVESKTMRPVYGKVYNRYRKFPYNSSIYLFRKLFPVTIPFNGFLINKETINEVGFPESALFYMGDDVEYCIRIIKRGFEIAIREDAIFYHPTGKEYRYLGDLRVYFIIRNRIYALVKHYGFGVKLVKNLVKFLYLMLKGQIKLKVLFLAFKDGFSFRMRHPKEVEGIL
jgi:rhamnopyranosyl-N-acetylglucosaminyl-diphospho-decaprenol beta-1,3/1,4-galactofuranosyltransferase